MTRSAAPTGLPIESVIADIKNALADRSMCVLTAEPGAGKTTVVPLRLLDEPWLDSRRIVMLEPRRLAARASAARMAQLLGEAVGETVGVTTRDDRRVSKATRIEVVTEGVLTRRLQNDPTLAGTGLVIFDEFHERNQQGDLGLALLLDARQGFSLDFGVLVMSATIDAERVAALLDPADPPPVVACAGRTFDIDMHWRARDRRDYLEPAVVEAVRWALTNVVSGDLLVFLPGMAEIQRVRSALSDLDSGVDVLALHGSLPLDEQDLAIAPSRPGRRKVVLSTDIAESSLTVDGVSCVIDSGVARAPRFDVATGMTRLSTVSISRASADQRAGRAGRLGPGAAVRLWSKIEHGTRSAFSPAELTQVDLAPLRLELAMWGVRDTTGLRLLDHPPQRAWDEAGDVLAMLGAIDDDAMLTDRGRKLSQMPLHPRLGSIVLTAIDRGVGWMGCIAAAAIDERDVLRGRPGEVPTDLALRVRLIDDPTARHEAASGRSLGHVRRRAEDLARRVGCKDRAVDIDRLGLVVAAGFPDRIAQRRGAGRGRFRVRNGSGVRVAERDELAGEDFLVALDVAGPKKDSRVRLAASVDGNDLLETAGFDAEVTERLKWDRERKDPYIVVERHLGALDLGSSRRRPEASDEVTELLLEHVRASRLKALTWTDTARGLQQRVEFLRRHLIDNDWPDLSDKALIRSLDTWLRPFIPGAISRADIEIVSVAVALDSVIGHQRRRDLDRLVPLRQELPSGRKLVIDYSGEHPLIASRAQDFYGVAVHPSILDGALPLTIELLSPAQRPIQRTADLIGFWKGSWSEVRKDMAGRYPKHSWPADPSVG